MYRAALLCALVLLVAAPSHVRAVESTQKLPGASIFSSALDPDRAPLLPGKQTKAAPAAGNAAQNAASNVVPSKPIDTSAGNAAASLPVPAKNVAGAAQQQQQPAAAAQPSTQQQLPASSLPAPVAQQQQSKPAAAAPTPTVAQPAAPQLATTVQTTAQAQPQPQAQSQVPEKPILVVAQQPTPAAAAQPVAAQQTAPVAAEQKTPVAAQQPAPIAEQKPTPAAAAQPVAAEKPAPLAAQQPAPLAAQQPAHAAEQKPASVVAEQKPAPVVAEQPAQQPAPIVAQQPAPVAAQQPTPAAAAEPVAKPAPQQAQQPAEPQEPLPEAPVQAHAEVLSINSQAHTMGHHNSEPQAGGYHHYRSGVQHANSYPKTGSLKSSDNIEIGDGYAYSTYEAPEYRRHSGKAATKRLYKAYQHDQEDSDDYESKMAAYDRMQRLQKYYDADSDNMAAEDEGVSSFARPTSGAAQHYSSKAAKYAAQALKAQQKAQPKGAEAPTSSSKAPAQQPQAQTPQATGLAGFASALLKRAAGDKPAPTATLKSESVAAPEQNDELSFEEYLATPEGAKLLAHEQHRSAKKQQAAAKKQATQMLRQTSSRVNTDSYKHATPNAGRVAATDDDALFADESESYYRDGYANKYDGYDHDYEEYLAKKYGKKYTEMNVDVTDPANIRHSKLAMKGMRDLLLFRSINSTVIQTVGYTVPPNAQISTATTQQDTGIASADINRPVMITYQTQLTCGDPAVNPGMSVGRCSGSGMVPQGGGAMQQAQMYWTCDISADVSTMCGLRFIEGMTITAQGPVTVTLSSNGDAPFTLSAPIVPITAAYMPGRPAGLLGEVISLLSGVKGGSLKVEVSQVGNVSQGVFSFFLQR